MEYYLVTKINENTDKVTLWISLENTMLSFFLFYPWYRGMNPGALKQEPHPHTFLYFI